MCDTEDVVIENEYLEVLNDPENPNLELGLAFGADRNGVPHRSGLMLTKSAGARKWGQYLESFGRSLVLFADGLG